MSSLFFKSKYEVKHQKETIREKRIQNHIESMKCSREYATRYVDYENHMLQHYGLAGITGGLGMWLAHRYIHSNAVSMPLLSKPYIAVPAIGLAYCTGFWCYNRLTHYYLNIFDREVAHTNLIDYATKYHINHDDNIDNWETNIPLTPFERLKIQMERETNKVQPQGKKEFRRQGKDRDDNFFMFNKIRNLENIIYLPIEEVNNTRNPVELQLKVDTVKPSFENSYLNNKIEGIHQAFENYKNIIENSKNFRSVKDKFLGLPFMLNRHQQYPEPVRGTWQFDVFESIFGEPYDLMKDLPETEEKINKFNYHLFLHPSVINKYDTNSEEFEMYLRQLNIDSKTEFEKRSERREYFCKSILPLLNMSNDPATGYDIANYIQNKTTSSEYENYLFDNYSNQKEEALFREAEEYKYMDKNQPYVERVQYTAIDKNRIGLKSSELNELLDNPTKRKNVRRALEKTFPHYQSVEYLDKIKYARYRSAYIQTMLDNDMEMPTNHKDAEDVIAAQNTHKELSEDEQAMYLLERDIPAFGGDQSNFPVPKKPNMFHYDTSLNWNEYETLFPTVGFISPKQNRFELYNHHNKKEEYMRHMRIFNNHVLNKPYMNYIDNEKDANNEELAEKVIKASPKEIYIAKDKLRDEQLELLRFLEEKTENDTHGVSDDVTEEELDQALFEASFNKLNFEDEEIKSIYSINIDLKRRNVKEIEMIFKAVGFDAFEQWNDRPTGNKIANNDKFYTDKAQYNDPLFHLYSEVEHPVKLRNYIKKWRSGTEMRFKMPYYPETKEPSKTFNYL